MEWDELQKQVREILDLTDRHGVEFGLFCYTDGSTRIVRGNRYGVGQFESWGCVTVMIHTHAIRAQYAKRLSWGDFLCAKFHSVVVVLARRVGRRGIVYSSTIDVRQVKRLRKEKLMVALGIY